MTPCDAGYEFTAQYECVVCGEGTYSPHGTVCVPCPAGGHCPEDAGVPETLAGWYKAEAQRSQLGDLCDKDVSPCRTGSPGTRAERVYECMETHPLTFSWDAERLQVCLTGEQMYECPFHDACFAGISAVRSADACDEGYEDVLCGVCSAGFSQQSDFSCTRCIGSPSDDDGSDSDSDSGSGSEDVPYASVDDTVAVYSSLIGFLVLSLIVAVTAYLHTDGEAELFQRALALARAAAEEERAGGLQRGRDAGVVRWYRLFSRLVSPCFACGRAVLACAERVAERMRKPRPDAPFGVQRATASLFPVRPEKFKIMLGFAQVFANFGEPYRIPWPLQTESQMNFYKRFNLDAIQLVGVDCIVETSYWLKFHATLGMLGLSAVAVGVLYVWGIMLYNAKLASIPRRCYRCGYSVREFSSSAGGDDADDDGADDAGIGKWQRRGTRRRNFVERLTARLRSQQASAQAPVPAPVSIELTSAPKRRGTVFAKKLTPDDMSMKIVAMGRRAETDAEREERLLNRIIASHRTQLKGFAFVHKRCPTRRRVWSIRELVEANLKIWRIRMRLRLNYRSFQGKVLKVAFWIMLLAYPPVSAKILGVFNCVEIGNVLYLAADYRHTCDDAEWRFNALLASLGILVFVFGVPLLFFVVLWRARNENVSERLQLMRTPKYAGVRQRWLLEARRACEARGRHWVAPPSGSAAEERVLRNVVRMHNMMTGKTVQRYGFIFDAYKPQFWWFELFELGRKVFLNGFIIFFDAGGRDQILLGLAVLLGAMMVQLFFQPYLDPFDGSVASIVAFQLFLTLLLGFCLQTGDDVDPATVGFVDDTVISVVIVVTNLVAVGFGLMFVAWEVRDTRLREAEEIEARYRRALGMIVSKKWRWAIRRVLVDVRDRRLKARSGLLSIGTVVMEALRSRRVRRLQAALAGKRRRRGGRRGGDSGPGLLASGGIGALGRPARRVVEAWGPQTPADDDAPPPPPPPAEGWELFDNPPPPPPVPAEGWEAFDRRQRRRERRRQVGGVRRRERPGEAAEGLVEEKAERRRRRRERQDGSGSGSGAGVERVEGVEAAGAAEGLVEDKSERRRRRRERREDEGEGVEAAEGLVEEKSERRRRRRERREGEGEGEAAEGAEGKSERRRRRRRPRDDGESPTRVRSPSPTRRAASPTRRPRVPERQRQS